MSESQQGEIEWRNGDLPVSTLFDDPYFSLEDGLAETSHVFLRGNDLPGRFRSGFHIAELGLGTGLNMLAVLAEWMNSGQTGQLRYTSFEAYPMSGEDVRRALQSFPKIAALADPLIEALQDGLTRIETDALDAHIAIGDARRTVPVWAGKADAWFLDGFAPAQNPELWEESLMQAVADHTVPGGTFATYTAAGFVRRGLAMAGFNVTRSRGFGRKRHMTSGQLTG